MTPGKNDELRITILDGYTDEPSTLGVPPYIAPIPRYIYGAIKNCKKWSLINYITIDEFRRYIKQNYHKDHAKGNKFKLLNSSKLLIVIAGSIVPGKYLSGSPISLNEILDIGDKFNCVKFLGGARVRCEFSSDLENEYQKKIMQKIRYYYDFIITGDLDAGVYDYLNTGDTIDRTRTLDERASWSITGSEIVRQHPNFPDSLMVELEAGRGCVRYMTKGCSFCSEPDFYEPQFRPPNEIVAEVKLLYEFGCRFFRLGALSCIFSYFSSGIGETETPKPNIKMIEKLLKGICNTAPELKVLHLDNANPAIMAANFKETKKILKLIVDYCTSGNVLSFGLESADLGVIKANNLNTTPDEVFKMVELVNQYGSDIGPSGLPKLLPGLNFVYGLKGESKDTFEHNFEFLRSILDSGLLLRRINLRQVLSTKKEHRKLFNTLKFHSEFIKHKMRIREQIDLPMLQKICPQGAVLSDVFMEKQMGNISFGRQIGTYPILVGIQYKVPLQKFFNIVITSHGYRSLTGFITPFNINKATIRSLEALPNIGNKRAIRISMNRPYYSIDELNKIMDEDDLFERIKQHIGFNEK